jgi:AcrR family transcriptional regulator
MNSLKKNRIWNKDIREIPYSIKESYMTDKKKEAKSNKAQEIIQATYSVILEEGFCNTTTQMISQKAGITKSMLHYYFKDKGVLMLETNRYVVENLIRMVRKSVTQYSHDADRINKRITRFWETIKKNIDLMIVLYATSINSLNDPQIRLEFGEFYGMILNEVKNEIISEYKHLNVSEKDAEAIASILMGALESLIQHYMFNPNTTDFNYSVKMLIRLITNAIPISIDPK